MPKSTTRKPETLHPRLARLNQEMAIERRIDIDDRITAFRNDLRFRITVFRHPSTGFTATTKVCGRLRTYTAKTPAAAVLDLISSLKPIVRRYEAERAEVEYHALQTA